MSDYESLPRRLRDKTYAYGFTRDFLYSLMCQAADAIEELDRIN